MDLGKAEYMIRQWRREGVQEGKVRAGKNEEDELRFYRNNLEWLLMVFEGSMDEKIFEMMMDKLNFDSQDYLEKEKKLTEFTT